MSQGAETAEPLVTIGVSTFNRSDSYLPDALEGAVNQTYENLEVVVADNASTDSTANLVRRIASPRLRYFRHSQNIGPNANFNFCLQQAKGRYFLLLHDDDALDRDMVEKCMTAAMGTDVGVIRCGTRVVDANGRVLSTVENECQELEAHELFLNWFRRKTSFYLASTLYHTERLKASGGFSSPHNLFQDVVATARLAVPFGRVDVRDVKASFRRHGANKGSGDSALDWAEDSLYLLELLEELLPEHAQQLRSEGLPYLCRKCYMNAEGIPSATDRWRTYLDLYNRFGRTYSPIHHRAERLERDARRRLRSLLPGYASRQSHAPS